MTKKTIQARDFMSLTSRHITDEGYLVAPGNIARTGIQEYRAYELGLDADGMDPMKVIRLHRPPEEVFDAASMASFEGKPITIEHPPVAVTSDNWSELAKGDVRGIGRSDDLMTGTLVIRSKDAIEAVQDGKAQLSNGYTFELDMTSGTTADGRAFDGIQRNIRGNHVALVDAARCGSACRIADSQPKLEGKTMADAKRKVTVDGIPLEVEDTAAEVIDTLIKQRNEARDALVPLQTKAAEVDGLKAALDKANADNEALKKDVVTPEARDAMVADWAKLIGDAKRLVPDLVTDGKTCAAIRREMATALMAKSEHLKRIGDSVLVGKPVADASPDALRACCNALIACCCAMMESMGGTESMGDHTHDHSHGDAAVADALLGASKVVDSKTELTGRDKFMARQSMAWQKQ